MNFLIVLAIVLVILIYIPTIFYSFVGMFTKNKILKYALTFIVAALLSIFMYNKCYYGL
jgi:hypothetical protein